MERNVRTLGVIFATLALIASVLVMPNVSAEHGGDLHISVSGDDGITSYASSFGHATYTATISSDSGSGHTNVVVSASFAEGSGWLADQATISDCSDEGSSSYDAGDLVAGETLDVCISVSIQESGSEVGDEGEMTLSVVSDEDTDGMSTDVGIVVSNWFAYSNDGAKAYAEGDTNTYTITVQNIKVDEAGDDALLEDDVFIEFTNAGEGWNIDSDNLSLIHI